MKRSLAALTLSAAALVLTGCSPVSFLYPLFEDSKDLAADTDISGNWTADGDQWIFRPLADGTYSLKWTNGKESEERSAALVRVSNYLFLDLASEQEGTSIRGHEFLMVRAQPDRLEVAALDGKWLETKIAKERALPFEKPCVKEGKNQRCTNVVTAGTAELQNFLMRYAGDKEAFSDWAVLRRTSF